MRYNLVFFTVFILFLMAGIDSYSYKIAVCNSSSNNTCFYMNETPYISQGETNARVFYKDGYIHVTNDTPINYTINTITNITNYYVYNVTNGSINIIQNLNTTDNYTYINNAISNILNSSIYNKSQSDNIFATKNEINEIKNTLGTYAYRTDIDYLNNTINEVNLSGLNMTELREHLDNPFKFNLIWVILIGINILFTLMLIIITIRNNQ